MWNHWGYLTRFSVIVFVCFDTRCTVFLVLVFAEKLIAGQETVELRLFNEDVWVQPVKQWASSWSILKDKFQSTAFLWEVIRYHRPTWWPKVVLLLVEIWKMRSRDLYTVALLLPLPLLPHIIHLSLTVDPPDSHINLKQRTETETEIHHRETKALVKKCPPPCFVTFFLWCWRRREFIVRCTKRSPLFPQNHLFGPGLLFCMWVLKVWSERAERGNSFRAGYKNVLVKL